jgi:hypothetical protein
MFWHPLRKSSGLIREDSPVSRQPRTARWARPNEAMARGAIRTQSDLFNYDGSMACCIFCQKPRLNAATPEVFDYEVCCSIIAEGNGRIGSPA